MARKSRFQVIVEKIKSIFGKDTKKKIASAALGAAVGIGATIATAPKDPNPDQGSTRDKSISETEPETKERNQIIINDGKSDDGKSNDVKYDDGKSDEVKSNDGTSSYVIISEEGARLRSKAKIDDNIVGHVEYGDIVLIDDDFIISTTDGHTWGLVLEIDGANNIVFEDITYVALDDDIAQKIELQKGQSSYSDNIAPIARENGLQKYQDIEISQEDMQNLLKFTCSWENQQLYAYMQGTPGYSYEGNEFIENCITKDGLQYICYDDGNLNYGFGVMVYANCDESINTEHIEVFKEYGYDMTSQNFYNNYLKAGESTIPVEVVNDATRVYLDKAVWNIQQYLREKDINFSKCQILALAGMSYQYGKGDSFVHHFIDSYIDYGGNVQEFIDNYETRGGTAIFYNAPGGSQVYKEHFIERSDAYTMAFRDGIFAMGAGPVEEIVINEQSIEEMQQNVSNIQGSSSKTKLKQNGADSRQNNQESEYEDR